MVVDKGESRGNINSGQADEENIEVITPILGNKEGRHNSKAKNDTESFLNKYADSGSIMMSNHLYKYANPLTKEEYSNNINNIANQSIKPVKEVDPEYHAKCLDFLNKRLVQRTPISSNAINPPNCFKFETPAHHNDSEKQTNFKTPSSGGESLTTATSVRKISNKAPKNYGAMSPEGSRWNSIATDIGIKYRYTPISWEKGLMKQSLERIDNAVKRYGKMIYPNEVPPPFEVVNGINNEQIRSYLQSENGSMLESMQMHNIPFTGINMYMQNQAYSEQYVNSVVWESDWQDADNFTLGPAQFSNLDIFSNKNGKISSKNLINEFRKEEYKHNKPSLKPKKRRSIGKFASADRAFSQRNVTIHEKNSDGQILLRNHNVWENPFAVANGQINVLNRERSSAPQLEIWIKSSEDNENGIVMDEKYRSVISSLRSTPIKFPKNGEVNLKVMDSKRGKVHKQNRVYYSQSPSPPFQEYNIRGNNFKNSTNKNIAIKLGKIKDGSKLHNMQKRIMKAGSNNNKFPKDFF